MEYNPDRWVMLKFVTEGHTTYKILAGWGGGYLYGQSWKLNSGCTHIEEDGDYFLFHGFSGSVYRCHKRAYGTTGYTAQIYNKFEKQIAESAGASMEMMPKETNFMELHYE